MESIVKSLPDQILKTVELSKGIPRFRKPDSVIIAGMGGSGIAGELFASIYQRRIDVPIIIHHGYGLPRYFSKKSLLILISYSGNTEEMLSTLRKTKKERLATIVISSGGKLIKAKFPSVLIPGGLPPRGALGYLFTPIPFIARKSGLIDNPVTEILKAVRELKVKFKLFDQLAKKIARSLYGRIPFVYASIPELSPVAYRWRCQLNENAKVIAHTAYLPEMNHNEIVGLESLKKLKLEATLIVLRDKDETLRIRKRVNITNRIIKDDFAELIEIPPIAGKTITRFLALVWLGDLVTVHLARIFGVDPMRIDRIDRLKKEMKI